jgi:hypothetical protein
MSLGLVRNIGLEAIDQIADQTVMPANQQNCPDWKRFGVSNFVSNCLSRRPINEQS